MYELIHGDCIDVLRQMPDKSVDCIVTDLPYGVGIHFGDKGDNDRAIADFSEAIGLDPKDATAYYNRGRAYAAKGDYDRAIADFSKAIELDPKNATAYYIRGNAYAAKGDHDKAIGDFRQTLVIDPNAKFAADKLKELGAK